MKLIKLAAYVASASLLVACGSDSDSDNDSPSTVAVDMAKVQQVLNTNADIAYKAYSDSVTTAEALKTALTTFATTSNAANLEAAKKAWLVAREPYGQTEVYRFRNSPIDDDPTTADEEDGPEGDINAWPLGEALIDYVEVNGSDFTEGQVEVVANAVGINANADGVLATDNGATADNAIDDNGGPVTGNVASQNIIQTNSIAINTALFDGKSATNPDESDVITGYHAIEFLLWGQDLNSQGTGTDGTNRDDAVKSYVFTHGGQRPLTDFTTDPDANRRHQYMSVVVDKLIDDLEAVRDQWTPDTAGNYRATFTNVSTEAQAKQKLAEILTGMGTMAEGELAGERMKIALNNNSQEDEHSCFSDNTHRDIWLNAEGVANSFFGEYAGYDSTLDGTDNITTNAVDGYGIYDYLNDVGLDTLAEDMKTAFEDTETKYTVIDTKARAGQPFDVLIANGDASVGNTIKALNSESNGIQKIADDLNLGADVVDDEASACDTTSAEPVDGEDC